MYKSKRKLRGGALGFAKRKKKTYEVQKSLEDNQRSLEEECDDINKRRELRMH